jgi:diguanylate cyclase (GGDEF)-like protein
MADRERVARALSEVAMPVAIATLASIVAAMVVTSLGIVYFLGFNPTTTIGAAEVWRIGLTISTIAPALICPVIATRMALMMRTLRHARDELANAALLDPLTGLLNRRGFDAAAVRAYAESRRRGKPIAALMCDVDMFKAINDKYGHDFGDMALKNLAGIIEASLADRDAVMGRQGGEEFAILLPGVDVAEATEIAETLRAACASHLFVGESVTARITLSIGIATEAPDDAELRSLLGRADAALYQAKRDGRNRVVPALPRPRLVRVA